MSSLPQSSDDYAAPTDMQLNKAAWDAALTDIGARLRAAEAIRASFQALIDVGVGQALVLISENVAPEITALGVAIDGINSNLSAAQAAIDSLLSGNLPAANVTESGTRVFVTPAQKAAIGTNTSDIAANTSDIATNAAAITSSFGQSIAFAITLG